MYRVKATVTVLIRYALGSDFCLRILAGLGHDADLRFNLPPILSLHRRTRSNCHCSLVELRSMYGHTMPISTPGNNRGLADRGNPGTGETEGRLHIPEDSETGRISRKELLLCEILSYGFFLPNYTVPYLTCSKVQIQCYHLVLLSRTLYQGR